METVTLETPDQNKEEIDNPVFMDGSELGKIY